MDRYYVDINLILEIDGNTKDQIEEKTIDLLTEEFPYYFTFNINKIEKIEDQSGVYL